MNNRRKIKPSTRIEPACCHGPNGHVSLICSGGVSSGLINNCASGAEPPHNIATTLIGLPQSSCGANTTYHFDCICPAHLCDDYNPGAPIQSPPGDHTPDVAPGEWRKGGDIPKRSKFKKEGRLICPKGYKMERGVCKESHDLPITESDTQSRNYPYPVDVQMPQSKPCEWRYAANGTGDWGGVGQGDMCYGDGKWNIMWDANGGDFEYNPDAFDWQVRCPRMGFEGIYWDNSSTSDTEYGHWDYTERWIDTLYGVHSYGDDQGVEWIEGCDWAGQHSPHERTHNAMTAHGIFIPHPEEGYPIGSMKPHRFFIKADDGIKFLFSGDTFAHITQGGSAAYDNTIEYGQMEGLGGVGPGGTWSVYDWLVGDESTGTASNFASPNQYSIESVNYCFSGGGSLEPCTFEEWYNDYSNKTYSEASWLAPSGELPGQFHFSSSCNEASLDHWEGDGGGNMNPDFWPNDTGCCVVNLDLKVGKMYPINIMYRQGTGAAVLKIKYSTGYIHDALGPHNCGHLAGGEPYGAIDDNTWDTWGGNHTLPASSGKGLEFNNNNYFEASAWKYGCCNEDDEYYDPECSGYVAGGTPEAVANWEVIMTTGEEAAFIGTDGYQKTDGSWCYCFEYACATVGDHAIGGTAPGGWG